MKRALYVFWLLDRCPGLSTCRLTALGLAGFADEPLGTSSVDLRSNVHTLPSRLDLGLGLHYVDGRQEFHISHHAFYHNAEN